MIQVSWNVCFRSVCGVQKLNNRLRNCVPVFADKSVRSYVDRLLYSVSYTWSEAGKTTVAGIYVGEG